MARDLLTVRLTGRVLERADGLARLLRARLDRARSELLAAFELKAGERPFARALLERHPRLWVFRTNQRRFAGDFVVIDMSEARVEARRAWAIDLKLGARVQVGGGGAGNAFVALDAALEEIARDTGALAPGHAVVRVTGDPDAVLAWLDAQTG